MRKPAMILFDYAHTLAWEPQPDFLRGEKAVFRHVKANPRSVTPEEAARLGTELFLSARDCRHSGWEPHEHQYLRLKYDLLGLTFCLPLNELEKLYDAEFGRADFLPDRLEAGKLNVPGIAGLNAGIDYVNREGLSHIFHREHTQVQDCVHRLKKMGYNVFAGTHQAATVSFVPQPLSQTAVL